MAVVSYQKNMTVLAKQRSPMCNCISGEQV